MSEESSAAPTESAEVSTGSDVSESSVADSGEPDWSKIVPKNATGAEASKIMAEYKARQAGAPAESAVKEAAREASRKLKIGDQEIDEDEVIKTYQDRKKHQQVASRELNEGKQLRKQAEDFAAMLKDPEKFFEVAEKLGHDVRSLTEKKLARLLEDELMDPKDKEIKMTKARLAEYERRDQEEKDKAKADHNRAMEKKYATEYETQFLAALKDSELPATKPMIAEMAKYIGRGAELGFKMTAAEAASLVKEDLKMAQARLFKDGDIQTLLSILGDDFANKIRTHDISKLKSPEQFLTTPARNSAPREKKQVAAPKRITAADRARFRRS